MVLSLADVTCTRLPILRYFGQQTIVLTVCDHRHHRSRCGIGRRRRRFHRSEGFPESFRLGDGGEAVAWLDRLESRYFSWPLRIFMSTLTVEHDVIVSLILTG